MTVLRPRVRQSGSMACAGGVDPSCGFAGPGCERRDCSYEETVDESCVDCGETPCECDEEDET